MSELTNEQLLVSSNGTTLDADGVRLVAPLIGEAAYFSPEELSDYALEKGAPLVQPGEGVPLDSPELADYLLVDTFDGSSYSTDSGWVVLDYSTYQADPDADTTDPESMAKLAQEGAAPGAPANYSSLEAPPFVSVTGIPS